MLILRTSRWAGNPQNYRGNNGTINWSVREGGSEKRNAQQAFGSLASYPQGARHPISWMMAQKNGGMSSHNMTFVTITPTATAIKGLNGSATTTITLDATATGQMIAAAIASGGIVFAASGSIFGTINGSGTATIDIDAAATASATGWMDATAYLEIDGTLVPYAIGWCEATTEDLTGLTPEAIAAAVWNALLAQFNESGSFGEALAAAGTAGDPWTTILPGGYTGEQAGKIIGEKLLTTAKFMGLK